MCGFGCRPRPQHMPAAHESEARERQRLQAALAAQSAAYAAAVREGEAREQQRVEGVLAAQTAVHAAARESEAQERQQLQAALAAQTEDVRRMHELMAVCAERESMHEQCVQRESPVGMFCGDAQGWMLELDWPNIVHQ